MLKIDNDGIGVAYRVEGRGSPLVLLHGFTDSSESWYEFGYVNALKAMHRLILIDSRGHGQSDKPHLTEAYTPERLASDVTCVLDDLGHSTAAFWGYSQGGGIGFALAKFARNRFSSFILGGAAAGGGSAFPSASAGDVLLETIRKGPDALIGIFGGSITTGLASRLRTNDSEALIACRQQRLVSSGHPDVPALISVPCLLYAGTADPIHDAARESASQIAGSQFVSVPDLNHVETMIKADVVLPKLRPFLNLL